MQTCLPSRENKRHLFCWSPLNVNCGDHVIQFIGKCASLSSPLWDRQSLKLQSSWADRSMTNHWSMGNCVEAYLYGPGLMNKSHLQWCCYKMAKTISVSSGRRWVSTWDVAGGWVIVPVNRFQCNRRCQHFFVCWHYWEELHRERYV